MQTLICDLKLCSNDNGTFKILKMIAYSLKLNQ